VSGELVRDVTSHPVFARSVSAVADLYDMQHDPKWVDTLTYHCEETGEKAPVTFLAPETRDELGQRREAIKVFADATLGLVGRSPDFLNAAVMAFGAAHEFFSEADARFGQNVLDFYRECRDNDVFLAHATINPQVDRSKTSGEQDDPFVHLRIVRETSEGLVVRGAKMIGTMVPIADEIIVFPLPLYRPGDEPYTVAFAVPVSTPGLRIICREPFSREERSLFDHPLSRFDEMDATCVFDDVVVPWDRVFFHGNVDMANELYDATNARHHTGHQGIVRNASKAEFLVAVAVALAEAAKTNGFLHVQEMLGEIIGDLELVRGGVLLAEERASGSRWGTMCPDMPSIYALRYHFPRMCARMVEVIQILGGGSLLSTPTEADMTGERAEDIERFLRGAGDISAWDRVRLLKLAWDATGDSFGQRQLQYERYQSGDPVRLAAAQYRSYDKTSFYEMIERALPDTSLRKERSAR
jgi:4-hydroxyphenylacetate 3-monooxygenase/anthranilate 3-monooxygenase (FAD)/4-hydroxyphenylacetate 3-monooxygenase